MQKPLNRLKTSLCLLVALFCLPLGLFAQTTYHIGNSLTDTNNGWLAPITQSAGKSHTYLRSTIPGAPTDWIWDHPGSAGGEADYRTVFSTRTLDHIFTQPFAGHCRSIDNEADYSGRFFTEARRNNANVQHWLYMQWPSTSLDDCWSDGRGGVDGTPATNFVQAICNFRVFFEKTRDLMDSQQPGKSIRIMPSGLALAKLKIEMEAGRVPGMTDFNANVFTDGLHLTDKGSYLVSLTHYVGIYGESPVNRVTHKPASMTEQQATIFKQIAWDVVSDYPWSGLGGSGTLANAICNSGDGGGTTPPPPPITVSGNVEREVWNNVTGTAVSAIPVNTAPSSTSLITSLEGPTNVADNYGSRIRGYIVPSTEGWYTLYIAGDDNVELWFSSGTNPSDKSRVAYVPGWTGSREWGKYPEQKSSQVYLVKGGKFYFEVLHKEATGGDNVAVAWTGPGITTPTVIGSANLDKYTTTSSGFSGTYKITARHSGKALDVTHSSTADGANVQQWPDNGTAAQQWIITPTTDGYYKLVSKASGKALEVANNSLSDGGNVQQWSYTGSNSQQWKIEATTDGYYRLLNRNSGKALDVAGVSAADGANVHQWNYVGGNNQQWKIDQLSTATTRLGEEEVALADVTVYPNPAKGTVNLKIQSEVAQQVKLSLTNAQGKQVISAVKSLKAGENTVSVAVDQLAAGLYFVKVQKGAKQVVKKVIITQ